MLLLRDAMVMVWIALRSIGFQQHTNIFGLLEPVEEAVERRFCGDQCLDLVPRRGIVTTTRHFPCAWRYSCGAIDNHRKFPFLSCACTTNVINTFWSDVISEKASPASCSAAVEATVPTTTLHHAVEHIFVGMSCRAVDGPHVMRPNG
jgi:hypothetical protein